MSVKELDKVKLGPQSGDSDPSYNGSDTESDESQDDGEIDYVVDYIKYAHFCDTREERENGKIGWHYGIAWHGYMKNKSDTEGVKSDFNDNDDPDGDIAQFWRAAGRKVRLATHEPKGRMGELVEPPQPYIRAKFREINQDGQMRSLERFWQRRELERNDIRKIPKKLSDYYLPYNRAQRRAKVVKRLAEKKRKRIVDSDGSGDEATGPASAEAGPSRSASHRAKSPGDSDLDILDAEDDEEEDDVPLAKRQKQAEEEAAAKAKAKAEAKAAAKAAKAAAKAQEEAEARAKALRKQAKKEARRKAEAEEAERMRLKREAEEAAAARKAAEARAARRAEITEAEKEERMEKKRLKKEREARKAEEERKEREREAKEDARREKEEEERKKKLAEKEAAWGSFNRKSTSNTPVPLPRFETTLRSFPTNLPPTPVSSVPHRPNLVRPTSSDGHFGEPEPGIFEKSTAGLDVEHSGRATPSSGGSLFAGDDQSLVPEAASGEAAVTAGDALSDVPAGSGPGPHKASQQAFAAPPARAPSPRQNATSPSMSPRSKPKPILIDLEQERNKEASKPKMLEPEPNKVLGRIGLNGPPVRPSQQLPPTPVTGNAQTPTLPPAPVGPRAMAPGDPRSRITGAPPVRPNNPPQPVAMPLFAHAMKGTNVVPLGSRSGSFSAAPGQSFMPSPAPSTQGGYSPIAPSPNAYGGMSPAYGQSAPGASPHWQPNQPVVQPQNHRIPTDPRKRRPNGGTTPDHPSNMPVGAMPASLPAVPEYQPLPPADLPPPSPAPTLTKVSSYQPRRSSTDQGVRTIVKPRDAWTVGTARHVIAAAHLVLPMRHDNADVAIPVRFINGSSITPYTDSVHLASLCARAPDLKMFAETLESYCLEGHLAHGAKIVEWAKVAYADEASVGDWKYAKAQFDKGKIFAAYADSDESLITRHYAIVFASAKQIDFAGLGIAFGGWKPTEVDFAAFLVSLPFTSASTPALPNPVRPVFEPDTSKPDIPEGKPVNVLESYGVSDLLFDSLSGKAGQYRFSHARTPLDVLQRGVHEGFKRAGVQSISTGYGRVEAIVAENARLYHTLKSTTIFMALPRRTTIYSVGTSLALSPADWKLRTIWSSGGLVTFSPTFVLRSPDKFAEIMQMLRPASNWAAYVIPAVIEYCNNSWDEPQKCPDSTNAFAALSKSLFLDEHLLRFSGSAASSGGGLAISTSPPNVHQSDACMTWLAWLKLVYDQRDFHELVQVCQGVRSGDWQSFRQIIEANPPGQVDKNKAMPRVQELDQIDVEKAQIEDLIQMRTRTELMPYRRYLYVGEMSLDAPTRERLGRTVEFVRADDFSAIFSGAV